MWLKSALCVHAWLLVSHCASKSLFTNSWAVEVRGGTKAADKLAQKHGFRNYGQVGNIPNVYHFKLSDTERSNHLRRFDVPANHQKILALHSEPEVGLVEQQVPLHRVKKTYSPPTDPLWDEQWYLGNTGQTGASHFVRDLNVEPLWVQGVTGCNSIVAIVDDGVEYTHPDLNSNYAASLGYDYADDDSNPFPVELFGQREDHGTSCAGEIAMVKNNGVCGVGVAYQSSITGIRLLGERSTTDIQEAMALSHLNVIIDIYSNSWGPSDNGNIVDGPGRLTQMALQQAAREGRDGKGSIFMWAAGNGGRDDSCAADGYVNSIYTIAIGAALHDGSVASFDEECSGKMATTFVSRQDRSSEITTTTVYSQCTDDFSGTSAACPLASATVALALEVNTNLTWRDVQYLIVYTSNPSILSGGDWVTNGAGLNVSHQFGFGALDAEALVTRARRWITVPDQQVDTVTPNQTIRTATALSPLKITFLYGGGIHSLEHVITTLTLNTGGRRGDMGVELTSPQGTTSTLLPYRSNDRSASSFTNWPFMSVHYWGEDPRGQWMLTVRFRGSTGSAVVSNPTVTFYGTAETPAAVQRIPTHCDPACLRGCAAPGAEFCDACVNLRDAHTLECINQCPPGYGQRKNYCYNSTLPEPQCDRHIPPIPTPSLSSDSCLSAGYTTCCTSGDCTGTGSCYCDQDCYSLDDCCTDIRDICSPPVSDYLQFLKLGTSPGVQRVYLPREDDGVSGAISIPGEGFPFGNSIQRNVYVSTNGYFSFGESINDYSSVLFPHTHPFFVAPFWADIAVRSGVGTISYEVHTTRNGQNASQLLSLVNQFVSDHQRTNFTGDWMLVAEWKQVPVFQVNIGRTNTFQGVVVTDGSHSYAVFTYHCGLMDWNGRAVIGFNANSSLYQNHRLAGTSDANDIACLDSPDTVWTNVVYLLFVRDMPFLSLGTTVGVSRVFLSFPDGRHSNSISINVPGGFPFSDTNQTTVYVGMDGFFSFGRAVTDWTPSLFPREHDFMVAPYWAHIDIHDRNTSSVSYEVHSASSNGSDTALLDAVSVFVSEWLQTTFEGKWMLVAEWSQVPQWRGNLSQTNTFQGKLITDGSRSYTVFTYRCGSMEWSGSATIGFNADNDLFQNHPLSRTRSSNSIACQNYPDSVWNNLVYQLGGISPVVPNPSPTSSTGTEAPAFSTQAKPTLSATSVYLTQIATFTPAPVFSYSQDQTPSYPQLTSSPQATIFSQVPSCVQVPGCTQTTAFPQEEVISTRTIVGVIVGGGICAVLFILFIITLILTYYKCHKRATVKLKMGNTHENKDSKDQSPALPFTSVVIDNVYATSENIYTTPVT